MVTGECCVNRVGGCVKVNSGRLVGACVFLARQRIAELGFC